MPSLFRSFIFGLAVMGLSRFIDAEDWPQWRGPRHDGVSRETGLLKKWPDSGPPLLWRVPMGGGYSSVSIADGRAYILDADEKAELAVALNAETGESIWRREIGPLFNDKTKYSAGPRSTPTLNEGRAYFFSTCGRLHCLNASDGTPVWQYDVQKEPGAKLPNWGYATSPLVDGQRLYVNVGQSTGSAIMAFDKKNGAVLWRNLSDKGSYATPVPAVIHGRKQILFFMTTRVLAADPDDGAVLWSYPWETKWEANCATPLVHNNQVFLTTGYRKGCVLLNISPLPDSRRFQATAAYVGTDVRSHFNTPIRMEDHLYVFDQHAFACVEWATGNVLWRENGFNQGQHIRADGHWYLLGETGKCRLALVKGDPEGFEMVSYVDRLVGNKCWTPPVIANGRLYVRDENQLVCLDIREKK